MHPFNHIFDKTIVKATVNSQTLMFEDNSGVAHCYDAIGCTFDELDDILEFTQKGPFYVEWMKPYDVSMFDGNAENIYNAEIKKHVYWKVLTDRGHFYIKLQGTVFGCYDSISVEYRKN